MVCRGGAECAWWLGFALFGWGYLLLATWSTVNLPTMAFLDVIAKRLGVPVQFQGGMGGGMGGMEVDFRAAGLVHLVVLSLETSRWQTSHCDKLLIASGRSQRL